MNQRKRNKHADLPAGDEPTNAGDPESAAQQLRGHQVDIEETITLATEAQKFQQAQARSNFQLWSEDQFIEAERLR